MLRSLMVSATIVVLVVTALVVTEREGAIVHPTTDRPAACCPDLQQIDGPTTSGSPATPQPCKGWLSGATGDGSTDGSFGKWRGAPVEIGGVWQYSSDLKDLQPGAGHWAWQAPLDVAVVPEDFANWKAEAEGAHDEFWRQTFRNAKALRQGRGTTYVRPYWEYNGDWYKWSVRTSNDAADFKRAWARMAVIFRQELPSGKLMLGTSASDRIAVSETYPDDVDVLSIDFYNNYPHVATQYGFDRKIESGSDPNSLMDLMRLAKEKGDPVLISEWSNVGPAREGGGGDAPKFVEAFHDFVADNCGQGPGQVIGEIIFNFPSHDVGQFWMWENGRMNPSQSRTAARYRELFRVT